MTCDVYLKCQLRCARQLQKRVACLALLGRGLLILGSNCLQCLTDGQEPSCRRLANIGWHKSMGWLTLSFLQRGNTVDLAIHGELIDARLLLLTVPSDFLWTALSWLGNFAPPNAISNRSSSQILTSVICWNVKTSRPRYETPQAIP